MRGFGDRFPIPVPASPEHERRSVWSQYNDSTDGGPRTVLPFRWTRARPSRPCASPARRTLVQRPAGLGRRPHLAGGQEKSLDGVLRRGGPAFQYAGARFTVCDAYHCSFTGGTNVNRLFLWTGTNDGAGRGHGPAMGNTYNKLTGGDPAGAYT